MKDLMSGNGEFKGISPAQKTCIVINSINVIKTNMLIGFGVSVDARYFNKLPRQFQKKHGNAQEFCFQRILRVIRNRIDRVGYNPDYISITFDHDMELSKPRLTRFDNIIKRDEWARELFVSICFANSKGYFALQAADMLAWETRRLLEARHEGAVPTVGSSKMFSSGGDNDLEFAAGEYWDEEEFEKNIDKETGDLKDPIDDESLIERQK
jgi:hypothetical protein